jgi:hypothetical protein
MVRTNAFNALMPNAYLPRMKLQTCGVLLTLALGSKSDGTHQAPNAGDNRRARNMIDERPAYCESGSSPC